MFYDLVSAHGIHDMDPPLTITASISTITLTSATKTSTDAIGVDQHVTDVATLTVEQAPPSPISKKKGHDKYQRSH